MTTIQTERLILRPWKEEDFPYFAALNADPEVMEHFPKTLTREESDSFARKFKNHIDEQGWGLWAAEIKETGEFIGFIGLNPIPYDLPFTPATEIGWRLARPYWGKGYATEGARAALNYAFETLGLPEVVSMTATTNERSQAVMERLHMVRDPKDDFNHPAIPEGHRLRRHVLYRISGKEPL